MATTTDNRKRSRDEECCDFMPLSKRINNLHIDNPNVAAQMINTIDQQHYIHHYHQHHQQHHHQEEQNNVAHLSISNLHLHNTNSSDNYGQMIDQSDEYCRQQHHQHQQHQQQYQQYITNESNNRSNITSGDNDDTIGVPMSEYSPELSHNENPYYYYKNKLLFEVHMERIRRTQ